jgi:D-alanyl-D-alanine carboxypeptidase/D-alanyl-D-alanine-endopeptidase (penicillin-binding protein 4)
MSIVGFFGCQTSRPRVQTLVAPPTPAATPFEALLRDQQLRADQVGYLVYDLSQKKAVASQNASAFFIPASVTKILTTLAALEVLGPNYRFTTSISYRGKLRDGKLEGDLYLKGTGDPLLTAAELMNLAQVLSMKGIREVQGGFYYDDRFFPHDEWIDPLQGGDAAYNSSVSALSTDFNRVNLRWSTPDPGRLEAYTVPSLPWIRPALAAADTPPDSRPVYRRSDNAEEWVFSRDGLRDGHQEIPVKDAARFTADLLAHFAEMAGTKLPPPQPGTQPAGTRVLASHESLPLLELVEKGLEFSNNLMAELFVLATARKLTGRPLSMTDSAAVVNKWWASRLPAVRWQGSMENGSGLSSQTRLSPELLAAVLRWADTRSYAGRSYLSLLPVSGWRGTLKERLTDPSMALRVWAKTGTIGYASGLAGYFFSRSNHKYAFAIFVLDAEKRRLVDEGRRNGHLAADWENASDAWVSRARAVQDALLSDWVEHL